MSRLRRDRDRASVLLGALSGCVPELQPAAERLVQRVWARAKGELRPFAQAIGVHRSTAHRMRETYPRLFDAAPSSDRRERKNAQARARRAARRLSV